MADKENNDVEGFDAEIERQLLLWMPTPRFLLRMIQSLKPAPSNDLSKLNEQDEPAQDTEQKDPGPDLLKTIAENQRSDDKSLDFSDDTTDVSDKLEVLIPNVLDTAEATNAAADVAAKAASALETSVDRLQERVDVLTEASTRGTVLSTRILIGSVTALILSAFIYAFMAFQLASRTSQIDGMLIAVGKRIVKMNSALATFEDIKLSIENLSEKQNEFKMAQSSVLEAVEKSEKAALKLEKVFQRKLQNELV